MKRSQEKDSRPQLLTQNNKKAQGHNHKPRKESKKTGRRKCQVITKTFARTITISYDKETKRHIWLMIFMDFYFYFCISLLALCLILVKLMSLYLCLLEFLLLVNQLCNEVVSIHLGYFACINSDILNAVPFYMYYITYTNQGSTLSEAGLSVREQLI